MNLECQCGPQLKNALLNSVPCLSQGQLGSSQGMSYIYTYISSGQSDLVWMSLLRIDKAPIDIDFKSFASMLG